MPSSTNPHPSSDSAVLSNMHEVLPSLLRTRGHAMLALKALPQLGATKKGLTSSICTVQ